MVATGIYRTSNRKFEVRWRENGASRRKRFDLLRDARAFPAARPAAARGRPAIGPTVQLRLDSDQLAAVDGYAANEGLSRAAALRQLTHRALEAIER